MLKAVDQSGASVSNITFTDSEYVGTTDACKHSLRRYTKTGLMWQWPLPQDLQELFPINLLEFIEVVVNI